MGMLSPHRRFVDPHNMEGIPKLRRYSRTPVPARDKPLPGTKKLATPRDERLPELLNLATDQTDEPSRSAKAMGVIAMAATLVFLALLWVVWRKPDAVTFMNRRDFLTIFVILGLGITHVLAIFSQIFSNGRSMLGGLSPVALYAGILLLAVLDHFLR